MKDAAGDGHATGSYAQEGEDIILREIFRGRPNGFYVDIGAHHPRRFSNTYLFYKQGWSGINIDATPGSMLPFTRHRPTDINLEIPIAADEREMTFYMFNAPELNTFDEALASRWDAADYPIVETRSLRTRTLAAVLSEYLPAGRHISFMSVDVEGLDVEVLRSNDWHRFRPECLVVECLESNLAEISTSGVYLFLTERGYQLIAKTLRTTFFLDSATPRHN